jgi:hypothetical protein
MVSDKVRILIRDGGKGFYYLHPNQWTTKRSEATVFKSTVDATNVCYELRLSGVDLVMDFGDPVYDIRLPVV